MCLRSAEMSYVLQIALKNGCGTRNCRVAFRKILLFYNLFEPFNFHEIIDFWKIKNHLLISGDYITSTENQDCRFRFAAHIQASLGLGLELCEEVISRGHFFVHAPSMVFTFDWVFHCNLTSFLPLWGISHLHSNPTWLENWKSTEPCHPQCNEKIETMQTSLESPVVRLHLTDIEINLKKLRGHSINHHHQPGFAIDNAHFESISLQLFLEEEADVETTIHLDNLAKPNDNHNKKAEATQLTQAKHESGPCTMKLHNMGRNWWHEQVATSSWLFCKCLSTIFQELFDQVNSAMKQNKKACREMEAAFGMCKKDWILHLPLASSVHSRMPQTNWCWQCETPSCHPTADLSAGSCNLLLWSLCAFNKLWHS